MPPKVFNTVVLVLAIAVGLLLLEPWGGSDPTEASPDEGAALTQAERDESRPSTATTRRRRRRPRV